MRSCGSAVDRADIICASARSTCARDNRTSSPSCMARSTAASSESGTVSRVCAAAGTEIAARSSTADFMEFIRLKTRITEVLLGVELGGLLYGLVNLGIAGAPAQVAGKRLFNLRPAR